MTRVEQISVDGDALLLRGQADFASGKLSTLRVSELVLGRTRATGSIRFDPDHSAPIRATVNGPSLDLSGRLERTRHTDQYTGGPPWIIDARFDRTFMAHGVIAGGATVHAETEGSRMRRLHLAGRIGSAPFALDISPNPAGRRVSAEAADAGRLLLGLSVIDRIEGGGLKVAAEFDDRQPTDPLAGTAELSDFRIRDAPGLVRVLQAISLYGLAEMASGTGLAVSRLIAPFRLEGDVLRLDNARAFSPSLGFTAKGEINFKAQVTNLEGTIVPAYFFNSLLGKIPFVGKMFSPEKGGGLFAATYAVRGPLDNPQVSVNPLAAVTPGVLRGIFGAF
ncbi:MAG: AsmA-like C-terminal domain-containing protein [Acetobacteraceae bacterium]|nr:AsmA-like C-terminal domain-containing protein [Acetobacteraceae bacterium]